MLVNSPMNVLEGICSWLRILEIPLNVKIVVHCCCLCILFTFILVVFVVVYLFTRLPFFVMLVFVVISVSTIICKQACLLHCFILVAFLYDLNVKRYKCKPPLSRFVIFVTILKITLCKSYGIKMYQIFLLQIDSSNVFLY